MALPSRSRASWTPHVSSGHSIRRRNRASRLRPRTNTRGRWRDAGGLQASPGERRATPAAPASPDVPAAPVAPLGQGPRRREHLVRHVRTVPATRQANHLRLPSALTCRATAEDARGDLGPRDLGPENPGPRCLPRGRPRAMEWERTHTQGDAMKVAVVPQLGAPLEIREVPVPQPGHGQVLVRIEASGLCHTDIHAARGDWPVKPKIPLIPGHEGVGTVESLGEGVDTLTVGDRVALPWLGHACGHCRYCVAGWETYCTSPQYMGYTMDGSYAEYAVGNASHVVRVPDGVSPLDAAPLTCAGVTTYKALKVAHPQPGETAMVVGIGGLGHLGLQYAKIFGTTTVAVDVDDAKLQLAKDLGADYVVDARGDQAAQLAAIGGLDIALVTVPSPQAMQAAHAALNPNGRLVIVGLPADNRLEIPVFETVLKGISVIGSLVGTRNDLQDCFALHAQGRTRVVAESRTLDDVNACFDEVLAGDVPARLVFDLS